MSLRKLSRTALFLALGFSQTTNGADSELTSRESRTQAEETIPMDETNEYENLSNKNKSDSTSKMLFLKTQRVFNDYTQNKYFPIAYGVTILLTHYYTWNGLETGDACQKAYMNSRNCSFSDYREALMQSSMDNLTLVFC